MQHSVTTSPYTEEQNISPYSPYPFHYYSLTKYVVATQHATQNTTLTHHTCFTCNTTITHPPNGLLPLHMPPKNITTHRCTFCHRPRTELTTRKTLNYHPLHHTRSHAAHHNASCPTVSPDNTTKVFSLRSLPPPHTVYHSQLQKCHTSITQPASCHSIPPQNSTRLPNSRPHFALAYYCTPASHTPFSLPLFLAVQRPVPWFPGFALCCWSRMARRNRDRHSTSRFEAVISR